MKYEIKNNSGSPIEFENEAQSLCGFAQKRFGFKKPPSLVFDEDQNNANKVLGKTGHYDPNTMEIHVFITGRHPKDILRSIAHELVHHTQHDKGELDQGGYSGQGYTQKNPHLRDMERQAYEMGNLCFRDWEDGLKENHPTIYNERRNRKMSLKDWKNKELGQNLTERWGFKMDLSKLNEGEVPPQFKDQIEKNKAKAAKKDDDSDEKESEEKVVDKESRRDYGIRMGQKKIQKKIQKKRKKNLMK
jgi:hypothetical protein